MFDLQRKVAIVTGAGSGIGAAIAHACSRGVVPSVIALDLDEAKARATIEALPKDGGHGSALQCDVSDPADVDAVFDRVQSSHPGSTSS